MGTIIHNVAFEETFVGTLVCVVGLSEKSVLDFVVYARADKIAVGISTLNEDGFSFSY